MSTINPSRPMQNQQRPGAPGARPTSHGLPTPAVDPFKVIRKHLTPLLASCVFGVLFGVAAWIALVFIYPLYTGAVTFEIKPAMESGDQVVTGDLDKDDVVIRLARTELVLLASRPVLEAAMSDPEVQATTWAQWFRDENGQFLLQDAVDELVEDLVPKYLPDTNLFQLEWSAHRKEDVPVVLNRIQDSYVRFREKLSDDAYTQDLSVFSTQEDEINRQIEALQEEMGTFVREHQIFTLDELRSHPLAYELNALNIQLAETKAQMSLIESQYEMLAAKLGGEMEPTEEDRLMAEADRTSLILMQQIMDLRVARGAALIKFGPDHTSIKEIDIRLGAAESEYETRLGEIMERNLNGQLKQSGNVKESTTQLILQLQAEIAEKSKQMNELAGQVSAYNSLVQRRDMLLAKLDATGVLVSEFHRVRMRTSSDRVRPLTLADTPRERSFPLPELIIPLGFLLVVGATLGVIFYRELTDKRVKSASDLAIVPGARLLGMIPDLQDDPTRISKAEGALRDEPRSVIAESYRQCCTPILKAMERNGHQTVVVAGGMPGSGSTTVVSNLAAFIVAGGKRALVVDANFRRPGVAQALGCSRADGVGLGDVLAQKASVAEAISQCSGGIDVMTAGTPAHRMLERLGNGQFESMIAQLRPKYDFIIFDVPPAVVAGEAMLVASRVDASVLVVRANQEHRGLVARLIQQFGEAQAELLGIILNRPRWTAGGYFKKNFATMAEYAAKSSS